MRKLQVGSMKIEIHADRKRSGEAAAAAAAQAFRQLSQDRSEFGVIFATGASQLDTLEALTSTAGLPWNKIRGFHLDEYVGIDENHPASFRRYLRENLTRRVTMKEFLEIDGSTSDAKGLIAHYAQRLKEADPQVCLLGIGENGHLAFNDPAEADFHDPEQMKVVTLDTACRQQQLAEGWFPTFDDVPEHAFTLTIPELFKVPKLIASVPGPRKAQSVRRTLEDPISPACPSTLLRTHPDVTLYLDTESASELGRWLNA